MRRLRDELRRAAQLLRALDQFAHISIDLALLQKKSALLDIRVGTLPRSNIQRFEEALGLAGYIAIRFFTNEEQVHMIVAGAVGQARGNRARTPGRRLADNGHSRRISRSS